MPSLDCRAISARDTTCRSPRWLLPLCAAACSLVFFGLLPVELQYQLMPSYVTEERYVEELYCSELQANFGRIPIQTAAADTGGINVNVSQPMSLD